MSEFDAARDDRSRAEFAYERLKAKLRSGELRAGQRLREAELAEALGISRTPVREALRRIASDGLVEILSGRGLIVTEFDLQQVRELYTLRGLLEGGAAREAARFATPSDFELMRNLLDRSAAKIDSPEETMQLNVQFHRSVLQAARNRYLERALAQMSDSLSLLPGTTFSEPGRAQIALQEHSDLLAALESRDEDLAERRARNHIEMAAAVRIRMMFAT